MISYASGCKIGPIRDTLFLAESITQSRNRLDLLRRRAQFHSQPTDVHVNGSGPAVVLVPPHVIENTRDTRQLTRP